LSVMYSQVLASKQRACSVLSPVKLQSAQLAPQNLAFAPIVTTRASAGDPQPAVSVPHEHADSDGKPVKRSFACAAPGDMAARPVKRICAAGAMHQEGAAGTHHPSHTHARTSTHPSVL
jgi:hypothetical protein